MILGKRILELRKKCGLTQEELGEKVNVTRQTISNWESGTTSPNSEQLKLLSKALNISIDEILDNELKNIDLSKIQITENQTKKLKKLLKVTLIAFIIILIIDIIVFIFCFTNKIGPFQETKVETAISHITMQQEII